MDMDDGAFIFIIILAVLGWILFWVAFALAPTELPNGCILYEDAIYCVEEASE